MLPPRSPGLPKGARTGDNWRVLLCTVYVLGGFALLAAGIGMWQFVAALRFPLHQRRADAAAGTFAPGVTLLKPLKGSDAATRDCLRSWFVQDYPGPVQILFAVQDASDSACAIVRSLQEEFPAARVRLEIVERFVGANAKVSKLAHLESLAEHPFLVLSDADVRVPADFLRQILAPLADSRVGLVNCFYRLANPVTAAMKWEAVAINADFWSQVLQSLSLKPQDFALGATMALPADRLREIGGFRALADHLADDYQLGNRIVAKGYRIELSPVVVECWDPPMNWKQVWSHQLRWNRTIRVCQPAPYLASVLSNQSLWWLLLLAVSGFAPATAIVPIRIALAALFVWRMVQVHVLNRRLAGAARLPSPALFAIAKDVLGVGLWVAALFGNRVVWRGVSYTVGRDGRLTRI